MDFGNHAAFGRYGLQADEGLSNPDRLLLLCQLTEGEKR